MSDFIPVSELKRRGWTAGLIDRFLGRPDRLKTNPHYASAAPMRLYDFPRVKRAEQSQGFQQAQFDLEKQRAAKQAKNEIPVESANNPSGTLNPTYGSPPPGGPGHRSEGS